MISSLQQLHTAARQSRNFLSNFQVAVQRKTSGRPRSEPEPARFFLCPPPRGQPTELLRSLCLGLGAPCYELKQKEGEERKKSKTASCCVTTTMRKGEWRYEVMRGGACTQHLCEEDKAHPRAV